MGVALTKESLDNTVRTVDEIKTVTELPVLSSISLIVTKEEINSRRIKLLLWIFAVIISVGVALILIDQYLIKIDIILSKLDEVWIILMERFKNIV
jgi:hypothetical protein